MLSRTDALLTLDVRLSERLRAWTRGSAVRFGAGLLTHSGDGLLWLAMGALSWWLGGGGWQAAGARVVAVTLVAAVLCGLAKGLVGRARPDGEQGVFYADFDRGSFPSGHATRVAALAVALVPWLPLSGRLIFAGWAVAICLSRVALGLHFLSDVVGGMLLGAALGGVWLVVG